MVNENLPIPGCFIGRPLSADELISGLAPETAEALAKISHRKLVDREVEIISLGDKPDFVYILHGGLARVSSGDESRKEVIRPVDPHEIIGVTDAVNSSPYGYCVETVTPCVVDCIDRNDFLEFLRDQPGVSFRLLQMLGSNLQCSYKAFTC